jgi:hypothetical protein
MNKKKITKLALILAIVGGVATEASARFWGEDHSGNFYCKNGKITYTVHEYKFWIETGSHEVNTGVDCYE